MRPFALEAGPVLAEIETSLTRLTGAAEQEFLGIGDVLSKAVDVFSRLEGDLAGLADQLHGEDAERAAVTLAETIRGISLMSSAENRSGPLLLRLEVEAAEVGKRLDFLRRIIGEVVALAINGKIQAAQVTATDVDFSVFTTDISRLGLLAGASTEQASRRLDAVRVAVASAREAASAFERNEAKELDAVRVRIETSLSLLAERRRRAALAADQASAKSKQIAQRIISTVSELQINDSVRQRIEHICTALQAMRALAGTGAVLESGSAWLNEMAPARRPVMIAALCRLQAAQLKGGADDYRKEVEGLSRNLSVLAADAAGILAEAEAAFAGGEGGGLFMAEIEQDIRRASDLLAAYAAARDRTGAVVGAVSEGFNAMEADLAAIRSIDADMRIMGLNATLKCGRLGKDGLALGIVAQELRACGRRTEECSNGIAALVTEVLALSDTLRTGSIREGGGEAADPIGAMAGSLSILSTLGESMADALAELRANAGGMSAALGRTAAAIDIHHRIGKIAGEGVVRLSGTADLFAAEAEADGVTLENISRLMRPLYTMDGERIIHTAFAKEDLHAPRPGAASDELENFFL